MNTVAIEKDSRQVARRTLFNGWWGSYKLSFPGERGAPPRRERRKMARAHAVGEWRRTNARKGATIL